MKKLISLILCFSLLFSCCAALTACFVNNNGQNGEENGENQNGNDENQNGNDENQNGNGENQNGNDENQDGNDENQDGDDTSFLDGELTQEKLEYALSLALDKIDYALPTFTTKFPSHNSTDNIYSAVSNTSGWNTGFWTGILWHAYELTGDEKYMETALGQIPGYYYRISHKIGVNHHDMGFVFTPSCVAAYKLTGDEEAKAAALLAAEHLITRYNEKGEFIQAWGNVGSTSNYRLIVDCLLNIPLLYWATEVTGNTKYRDIAYQHYLTTIGVCYREDGSTYHTYYFDYVTGQPLYGATHQGASDNSTWSRGQAWGMYGPLLTYIYEQDESALEVFKAAADYYLEYLPNDYVVYWDLSFTDGDTEPRDSSSAAIALCALLEGIKHLDEDDPDRARYVEAAKNIMNSLIDNYTTKDIPEANGLILHGTYNKPGNEGVDEMLIWGDYFYMEALHRMLDPEWDLYW